MSTGPCLTGSGLVLAIVVGIESARARENGHDRCCLLHRLISHGNCLSQDDLKVYNGKR